MSTSVTLEDVLYQSLKTLKVDFSTKKSFSLGKIKEKFFFRKKQNFPTKNDYKKKPTWKIGLRFFFSPQAGDKMNILSPGLRSQRPGVVEKIQGEGFVEK